MSGSGLPKIGNKGFTTSWNGVPPPALARLCQPVERGLIPRAARVPADGDDEQFKPADRRGLEPINPLRQEPVRRSEKHQREIFIARMGCPTGRSDARPG